MNPGSLGNKSLNGRVSSAGTRNNDYMYRTNAKNKN
jgi:hypothetical protein